MGADGVVHRGDGIGGRSPIDVALAALIGDQRTAEAAQVRSRMHWLAQQGAEEASVRGVLVDLAETGSTAVIAVRGRGPCPGRVRLVGADFAVIDAAPGDVVVPLAAIDSIRSVPGRRTPVGRIEPAMGLALHPLLAELAIERPVVTVTTANGDRIAGELRSVGRDLLRLADPDTRAEAVIVPLGSVCEVLIPTR